MYFRCVMFDFGTLVGTLFCLAALLFGAPATADIVTITDDRTFTFNHSHNCSIRSPSNEETCNSASRREYPILLGLDGFDSSLGTLLDVSVGFDTTFRLSNSLRVYDEPASPPFTSNVRGRGIGGVTVSVELVNPVGWGLLLGGVAQTVCTSSDGSCTDFDSVERDFDGNLSISPTDLSAFLGGPNTLQFALLSILEVAIYECPYRIYDRCISTASNYWRGELSVTYRYDDAIPAVPLPAAAWLFGTALLGFLGYGRRRKSA